MISSLISALSYLTTNRMVIELLLISQLHHWFQRAYLKESLKRNGDGHVHDVTKFYMCTEWQFYESTSQTSTLDQIIRSKGPFHHHTMRRLFHHGGRTGKRVRRELQVASLSTRNRENSSTWFSWTTSSWNAANYLTIYFIYLSIYIYIYSWDLLARYSPVQDKTCSRWPPSKASAFRHGGPQLSAFKAESFPTVKCLMWHLMCYAWHLKMFLPVYIAIL